MKTKRNSTTGSRGQSNGWPHPSEWVQSSSGAEGEGAAACRGVGLPAGRVTKPFIRSAKGLCDGFREPSWRDKQLYWAPAALVISGNSINYVSKAIGLHSREAMMMLSDFLKGKTE